jgi:hypothetical protein
LISPGGAGSLSLILHDIDEVDQRVVERILEINGVLLEEATLPDVGKALLLRFRR